MKFKTFFAGLMICSMLAMNIQIVKGQDPEGTYLEESGEAQDSTKVTDILDYDLEYANEKSNTGLMVGIAAVILVGGAILIFRMKKKK